MTVLVDTGVLYAHHDRDAARHADANAAFEALLSGAHGQPYVTDYVYDEAVTLARRRTGRFDAARTLGERLRGAGEYPAVFAFVHVDRVLFEAAVAVFERYPDQELSFTDAATVAAVEDRNLDAVVSFDDDFDGLVDRREPGQG